MKAAVYYRNGGPEVFTYEDFPEPVIRPDEILIKTKSISIEGGDSFTRETKPVKIVPSVLGYQSAGEIISIGENVSNRKIGQRVVVNTASGSHAELVAAAANRSYLIPEGLSYETASAIPIAFSTAHECLFTFGNLGAGQSVLIHGGSGAVGQAAIQLAKKARALVYTTGADDVKLEKLKMLGADHLINYKKSDFVKVIMEMTSGNGVNLVLDSVGGVNLSKSAALLSYKGVITFIGLSARDSTLFNPQLLWPSNGTITGVYAPAIVSNENERIRGVIQSIFNEVIAGNIKVNVDRSFPLSQVREAYEYLESKKSFGRVVLIP